MMPNDELRHWMPNDELRRRLSASKDPLCHLAEAAIKSLEGNLEKIDQLNRKLETENLYLQQLIANCHELLAEGKGPGPQQ